MGIADCTYRSAPIFTIRDETSKVTEKARRKSKIESRQLSRETTPCDAVVQIPQDVALPLEATAIGYFFSTFSRSGIFAYLPDYASTLIADEKVMRALCASALGSMAVQYNNDKLMYSARCYYSLSLTQTSRDLSESQTAVLDSTLLRVLLLSAFEALCFHDGGNPQHWTAHIQGSSNLLLMRGKAQLESPFGRLLFHHAGVNILIDSINHDIPVPVELVQLFEYATTSSMLDDPISENILLLLWQMAVIAPKMANMAAWKVEEEMLKLDGQAAVFQEELQEMAPYEVIYIPECRQGRKLHAFEGVMHRYQDQQTARLYNTTRLMRLTFRQWMFAASHDSTTHNSLQDISSDRSMRHWTIEKILSESAALVKDTLASVPYSLELLDSQTSTEARYLIWPLTTMARFDVCPSPARRYIVDRLVALADKFHLRRAMQAAEMLGRQDQEQIW
jgi:hypothetical protein